MPILNKMDRQGINGKAAIIFIYFCLIIGGATMVYPFLITITGSVSNVFDYSRRQPLPRFLWNRQDRLMRWLATHFPQGRRQSFAMMHGAFPSMPEGWRSWVLVGDEVKQTDDWAGAVLAELESPGKAGQFETAAADLQEFIADWPLQETILSFDFRYVQPFLAERYGNVNKLNATWHISVNDFTQVSPFDWLREPFDQSGYIPPNYMSRYQDLIAFRKEYVTNKYTAFLKGIPHAMNYMRPASIAFLWEDYAQKKLGLDTYLDASRLPFPVTDSAPENVRQVWYQFLKFRFPVRHVKLTVTPEMQTAYSAYLKEKTKQIKVLNNLLYADAELGLPELKFDSYDQIELTETVGEGTLGKYWIGFVRDQVPPELWRFTGTMPELAFQKFAMQKYGRLEAINAAYGVDIAQLEQLRIPIRQAILHTFRVGEWRILADQVLGPYSSAFYNMFYRGRAILNTIILVGLTVLLTLTVNPMAGYALSRFQLRHTQKIIIFCLATMSFPAAVKMIPSFLLLRDLDLLNSYWALVLPGAANGMAIFMLKGFFDSLPQELYEAATIDGAREMQIFYRISLPLVKPILAYNVLQAFIFAYSGWDWAIVVCPDPSMWTISVWTYQFAISSASSPHIVMAAYLLTSLPVFLVFVVCQKVIMNGIVLPQMK